MTSASNSVPVKYMQGHDDATLRSYRARTVHNSAAFLKPHLTPDTRLLDCGCGPGSITASFADLLSPDNIIGIDQSAVVIEKACADYPPIKFVVADIFKLPFPTDNFDVVFAHVVFQYLPNVSAAVSEMFRVCRPGGYIAVVDLDPGTMLYAPENDGFKRLMAAFAKGLQLQGGNPRVVREIPRTLRKVGFHAARVSASNYCYSTCAEKEELCEIWNARLSHGKMVETWLSVGIATREDLEVMKQAFFDLKDNEDGFAVVPRYEFLAQKPFAKQ